MNQFLQYLLSDADDPGIVLRKILFTVALVLISYLLMSLLHQLIDKVFEENSWVKVSIHILRTIVIIFVFYLALRVWFEGGITVAIIFALIIFFGGLAMRDLVLDITGYIYILVRHPFEVGDYIELHGVTGKVVDLDFMQINIQEVGEIVDSHSATGRYVSIPNRLIFEEPTYNYTHEHRFVIQEVYVLIGLYEDRQKALKLAGRTAYRLHTKIMEKYSAEDLEIFDRVLSGSQQKKEPSIRASLDDNGFRIYIRYFTGFEHVDLHNRLMKTALFDEFVNNNIQMPEPKYIRLHQ